MDCSSMVSIATFGQEIGVQIPAGLLSRIQINNWVINSEIIQAYDWATPIVIPVTVSWLVGGDK